MATTAAGTPYVVSSDTITSYPTTSLALANRVDAVGVTASAALTAAAASNLLYNGAMQVSQRGTSTAGITSGGSGYFTADRWNATYTNLGTFTQSIENDAPTGSGFRRSLKMLCTTADASPAAGDYMIIQQILEGQDLQRIAKGTASAQQLTLSFWVKSNTTGTYIAELNDIDNTRRVSASYTISASATWERKTITFPLDTTGAFDNDNAGSLELNFWLGAGSTFSGGSPLQTTWGAATNTRATGQTNLAAATNNYWQITGVQLETGSQATAFEFKSYGQELRECQRYYYRDFPAAARLFVTGQCSSTTGAGYVYKHPVTMRAAPTAVEVTATPGDYSTWRADFGGQALTSGPTFNAATIHQITLISGVASGLVAGNATGLFSTASAAYIGVSAEL